MENTNTGFNAGFKAAVNIAFGVLLVHPSVFAAQQSFSADTTDWKQGAVCYEIFVRSFYDSDGDGIGDLKGLTQKLDYIRTLGARCVWLMPVMESPSYHGYDATDYYRVERDYGTNADFKAFVAAAHERGIHVLIDLVLNHLSSEHPFFQEALRDTASPHRDWFRWSPAKPDVKGPWGQEVWHKSPVRDEYYYGIFWHGMPDLNYDNAAVREEAKAIARFWMTEMGVDGFRLDAVPYLVEEGNVLMHTRGTHDVLRKVGQEVRRLDARSYTVGEVWDSVGAMLPYYPDQLDSYFAFELSDAILAAVRGGSGRHLFDGYLRLLHQVPAERFSPFLRNHDQTRTMTVLGGDVRRAKLAATLLLTLPGVPFVYYGEEIGMTGDKPDERLRTPMHWNLAAHMGFTTGTPWEVFQADSLTANVAAEDADSMSLLSHYRRLFHFRSQNAAAASGDLLPLSSGSDQVAVFLRRSGDMNLVVVANLADASARNVLVISDTNALAPGDYGVRTPFMAGRPVSLHVARDGRVQYRLDYLGPLEAMILELTRAPRRSSSQNHPDSGTRRRPPAG